MVLEVCLETTNWKVLFDNKVKFCYIFSLHRSEKMQTRKHCLNQTILCTIKCFLLFFTADDNMDKGKELQVVEQTLMPHLEEIL